LKREVQIGSSGTTTRYDMQPVQPRVYDFMQQSQVATKKEKDTILALPPSNGN
jgi:hypothetical protein